MRPLKELSGVDATSAPEAEVLPSFSEATMMSEAASAIPSGVEWGQRKGEESRVGGRAAPYSGA